MSELHKFCTFYLDNLFLGVDVSRVQEIIRFHEMTTVPLSPNSVKGLINLRGQIVTAINLRDCFDIKTNQYKENPMNVVVTSESDIFSLLVDQIGDVLELSDNMLDKKPDTLVGIISEVISNVYKLDKQLLHILDVDKLIDLE